MKITSVKQQVGKKDRYSVFVDEEYSFSLSESALLESGIHNGQELGDKQVGEFKKLSADDKIRIQTLRYVAMRARTKWEVEFYLQKKGASPPLVSTLLNMLSNVGLIDDLAYAKTFIKDRNLLRPTSALKIKYELRKKRIDDKVIREAFDEEGGTEADALKAMIEKKRRQTKYQDDQKLMQYLARQGFRYDDIKSALASEDQ